MSRSFGWFAERQLPEYFRPTIYGLYSTAFGVNIDEAEIPDYKYVHTLFYFISLTPEKTRKYCLRSQVITITQESHK